MRKFPLCTPPCSPNLTSRAAAGPRVSINRPARSFNCDTYDFSFCDHYAVRLSPASWNTAGSFPDVFCSSRGCSNRRRTNMRARHDTKNRERGRTLFRPFVPTGRRDGRSEWRHVSVIFDITSAAVGNDRENRTRSYVRYALIRHVPLWRVTYDGISAPFLSYASPLHDVLGRRRRRRTRRAKMSVSRLCARMAP